MASLGRLKSTIFDREERRMQYQSHIRGLNAYDRHKKFMKDYVQFYGHGKTEDSSLHIKTDKDTLREGYRFILSDEDDMDSTWEKRLVKRYYDKLFKEYCIADMTQYKKGKIGLRWRTEKEVISGKGQFICGNKHCDERHGLASYEVNFSYVEDEEQKQALVKLVACKRCAEKLAYKRQKEREKQKDKELKERKKRKRKREHEESDYSSEDELKKKYGRRKRGTGRIRICRLCFAYASMFFEFVRQGFKFARNGCIHNSADMKGESSKNLSNNNEGYEEFFEGMFL